MLVSQQIIDNIDDIIERAYLDFTYQLVGDDYLTESQKTQVHALGLILNRRPLIELLYLLVRQRNSQGYRDDQTLRTLLDSLALSNLLPILSDPQYYTMEHLKRVAFENIQAVRDEAKKKVKQEILKENEQERATQLLNGMPNQTQRDDKKISFLPLIFAAVGKALSSTQSTFNRNFTVAATNTINNATLDHAVTVAAMQGKKLEEVKFYKLVVNDERACHWCKTLYQKPDGTPRIFTARELVANGTNEGRTKSQWLATVGSAHPRCRCQLIVFKE